MTIADPLSSSAESAEPGTAKVVNSKPQRTSASRKDRNIVQQHHGGDAFGAGRRRCGSQVSDLASINSRERGPAADRHRQVHLVAKDGERPFDTGPARDREPPE